MIRGTSAKEREEIWTIEGMMRLGAAVVMSAYRDLRSIHYQTQAAAVEFFESDYELSLFCALADVPEPDRVPAYDPLPKPEGLREPTDYSTQTLDIYKDGVLMESGLLLKEVVEITGQSRETLQKRIATRRPGYDGVAVVKEGESVVPPPNAKYLDIYCNGRYEVTVIGIKGAARYIGSSPRTVSNLIRSGEPSKGGFVVKERDE